MSYSGMTSHVSEALFIFHLLLYKELVGSTEGQGLITPSLVCVCVLCLYMCSYVCIQVDVHIYVCMCGSQKCWMSSSITFELIFVRRSHVLNARSLFG